MSARAENNLQMHGFRHEGLRCMGFDEGLCSSLLLRSIRDLMSARAENNLQRLVLHLSMQLTNDALIHIFHFLDVRSLAAAGLVCRSWSLAARENTLWQVQYTLHFGDPPANDKIGKHSNNDALHNKGRIQNQIRGSPELREHIDWYEAFKIAYRGHPSRVLISNRAYCRTCKSAIWLNGTKGVNLGGNGIIGNHQHRLKPMQPCQVLHFLLGNSMKSSSSSSSDSDSEGVLIVEHKFSKLWAYPRLSHTSD